MGPMFPLIHCKDQWEYFTFLKMRLEAAKEEEIVKNFPKFHFPGNSYFYIVDDNDEDIGVYGLRPREEYKEGCVEISVYIFENSRHHKQYKKIALYLLNYPFLVNFKCILIHTVQESVRTFLKACKRLNILPIDEQETWFYREKI